MLNSESLKIDTQNLSIKFLKNIFQSHFHLGKCLLECDLYLASPFLVHTVQQIFIYIGKYIDCYFVKKSYNGVHIMLQLEFSSNSIFEISLCWCVMPVSLYLVDDIS